VTRARWATLAVATAVALTSVAGCGSASKRTETPQIAIATPGGAHEIGWNAQGIAAARAVARQLHLRARVASDLGEGDAAPALERLAHDGASLLVAHDRRYAAAASAVAGKAKVPVLLFGSPQRIRPGRVGDVEVAAQEGGYVAGYIAARASFIPAVGIVVTSDEPEWYRTAGGFIAGARRFDPHVKISYARVHGDGDTDAAAAQRAAQRLIDGRAQMLLGLGRQATLGVMRATEDAQQGRGQRPFDAMFVDVVADKSGEGRISITGLGAVQWNFAPAYRQAIADLTAGSFGRHPYTLDLANGGLSIAKTGRTPIDNLAAALALGRKVARGEIHVPVATTNAQVLALLHARPAR
jgi:simple sugar transport system substrate-binding protein